MGPWNGSSCSRTFEADHRGTFLFGAGERCVVLDRPLPRLTQRVVDVGVVADERMRLATLAFRFALRSLDNRKIEIIS